MAKNSNPKKSELTENGITKFEEQLVDIWFNFNFNGRLAYKQLRPDVQSSTADVEASKILNNPKVKDYIEKKRALIRMKEDVDLAWIVSELKRTIFDVNEEMIERDPESGRITSKPDRTSKLKAIEQLIKIAGFETKKVDITTKGESLNQIIWNEELTHDDEQQTSEESE